MDYLLTNTQNIDINCDFFIISKNLQYIFYFYLTLTIAFDSHILVKSEFDNYER